MSSINSFGSKVRKAYNLYPAYVQIMHAAAVAACYFPPKTKCEFSYIYAALLQHYMDKKV